MEKMIVSRLREIEEKEKVHILLAVESGSSYLINSRKSIGGGVPLSRIQRQANIGRST